MNHSKLILLPIILILLGGCAITREQNGEKAKYFIGIGKISYPVQHPGKMPIFISDDTILGVNVQNGIGIGYFHTHLEVIPEDCRIYIKVNTKEDLDRVIDLLNDSAKEGLCVSAGK